MLIDTITAIATPQGIGGVGVVRVSGSLTKFIATNILKNNNLTPKLAVYTDFLAGDRNIIDSGIALYFQAPNSFTGEDVLELQAHGSPIILNLLLKRILALGARIAEPGEFSKRAFLQGKMDLLQAESVISLIHAQTEQAAIAATKSLQGEFSNKINLLLTELTDLRMHVEAAIDFPEEDLDFLETNKIKNILLKFKDQIYCILQQAQQGVLLSNGLKAVILGEPNVGKSSLLNLLSERELAIVTNIPGTTRDVLTNKINLDGLLIDFVDTAGIRRSLDLVESIGIKKAILEAEQADLILLMIDYQVTQEDCLENLLEKLLTKNMFNNLLNNLTNKKFIILVNKIDEYNIEPKVLKNKNNIIVFISVKHNLGINLLKQQIKQLSGCLEQPPTFTARTRHVLALQRVYEHIEIGHNFVCRKDNTAFELLAEELKLAQQNLSEITGVFTSDDLLGKIFAEFCIGK